MALDVLNVLRHVTTINLTPDFIVQQYAVLCVCKIASLYPHTPSPLPPSSEDDQGSDTASRGQATRHDTKTEADWLTQYITECLGCAELAVLNAVFCGVLYLAEARHPVVTSLFDAIVYRALELMRTCEDLQLVKRCVAALLFVVEQLPRLAEERGVSRMALDACMHMCLTTESREVCCCIVMGLERLVVSFALSHTMRQSLYSFAQSLATNGLCSPRARRLLSIALCCACLYTGDGDRTVDSHHTDGPSPGPPMTCGVQYATWLLDGLAQPNIDDGERQCCVRIIPHLLVDFHAQPWLSSSLVTDLYLGHNRCLAMVCVVVRAVLDLLGEAQRQELERTLWHVTKTMPSSAHVTALLATLTPCHKLRAMFVHSNSALMHRGLAALQQAKQ